MYSDYGAESVSDVIAPFAACGTISFYTEGVVFTIVATNYFAYVRNICNLGGRAARPQLGAYCCA